MIVVSDTSPVTYLIQTGQLPLLRELFGEVIIPSEVFRELKASPVNVPAVDEAINEGWVRVQTPASKLALGPDEDLDDGEAEAIALALEIKADLILIDERQGTYIARKLNLRVFGLLTILVQAKQKGFISSVKPLLDKIIQLNFRVSPNLYQKILAQVNE